MLYVSGPPDKAAGWNCRTERHGWVFIMEIKALMLYSWGKVCQLKSGLGSKSLVFTWISGQLIKWKCRSASLTVPEFVMCVRGKRLSVAVSWTLRGAGGFWRLSITTININTCPGRLAYVGEWIVTARLGLYWICLNHLVGFLLWLGPKPRSVSEGRPTIVLLNCNVMC